MERCSYKDFFCYLMDNHYDLLYEYVVDDMPDEVYGNPSAEEEYLEDLFIKEDKYLYRVLDDIFDDWDMCYEYAERMGWLDD